MPKQAANEKVYNSDSKEQKDGDSKTNKLHLF